MRRGYEMRAHVMEGIIQQREDGVWTIDDTPLDEWLHQAEGQHVVLVGAEIQQVNGERKVCEVCGTVYRGYDCPRCERARNRLRRRT